MLLRASRCPNRRVFRRSQILALGTAYLLIFRLGSSLRLPLALALRNSAALTSDLVFHGRPALSPGPLAPSDQTVLCQLRSGAPSNPSIFQRYPCSHCGRLRVVQPFRGLALQRLMRSAPGTASSISLKQLLCKLFPLCHLAHFSTPKSVVRPYDSQNSPPESRWATSPPRKMALGPLQASHWPPKCPLRSGPAGCASLIEVFNHRRTFAALLRVTAQGANTLDRAIGIPNPIARQMLTNS